MRSAVMRWSLFMGMVRPSAGSAAGAAAGAAARAGAGFAAGAGLLSAAFRMSTSVILPAGPVPVRVERSTPSSCASFLARGEAMIRPAGLAGSGSTLAGSVAAVVVAGDSAAPAGAAFPPANPSMKL